MKITLRFRRRTLIEASARLPVPPSRSFVRPIGGYALALGVLCLVALVPPLAGVAEANDDLSAAHAESGEMMSFDGTKIRYVVYVPDGVDASSPAPAILAGHHGGGPEDADPPDPSTLNATVRALLDEGFIVQTWAARGYPPSGGEAQFNSPDVEVRDVQALIDQLARRSDVVKDGPNDPRVGMVGESYGAWIQLLTAARDPRIDALSPRWTPYDILHDLEPNGVLRSGWTAALYAALTAVANYGEGFHTAFREALVNGKLTEQGHEFLRPRSAKATISQVKAPTLLVQSVSDTLTTANNAIDIYRNLSDRGVPTKLYLFCGGHTQALFVGNPTGVSCDPTHAPERIPPLVVDWMDTHLRGGGSRLGPPIQWERQDGTLHTAPRLPSAAAKEALQATLNAVLVRSGEPYEGASVMATPSPDGVRVTVPAEVGTVVLGVPKVTMTVSPDRLASSLHEVTEPPPEVYVFSKLVDHDLETGTLLVIDEQATPMSFTGSAGSAETKSFDLAAIAWKIQPGHELMYEVSPTSTDFAASRSPSISAVNATVRVPVVARLSSG